MQTQVVGTGAQRSRSVSTVFPIVFCLIKTVQAASKSSGPGAPWGLKTKASGEEGEDQSRR